METPESSYGQFCAIARALDVVGERWSLLIVREVMIGGHRFEEIRRGVPKISRTMLSQRLSTLSEAGVLEKRTREAGKGHSYHLTPMGKELGPLLEQLGVWGRRWLVREPTAMQLDPDFLLFDMQRSINPDSFQRTRTLVRIEFGDSGGVFYLDFDGRETRVCEVNPGCGVDLEVRATLAVLTRFWLGDLDYAEARSAGLLQVSGDPDLVERFPQWFAGGYFLAKVEPADSSKPA